MPSALLSLRLPPHRHTAIACRLRRRGRADRASWRHAGLVGAGVVVAVLALVFPLDAIGEEYLLVAHTGQHQLLLDLSPTADQHWAAALMTVEEMLVLGTAILVLAWPLLLRLTAPPDPE